MKKFLILLIIACISFSAFGITACVDGDGHNYSSDWSSDINKHWHKCRDAGCNLRSEYEDHDWVLSDTYTEATCGEAGGGQYTCSVCKATLGNKITPAKIPATGKHDYKLVSLDVEPSCGEEGYGSYICEICYNYAVLPVPATGDHDYSGAYKTTEEGHYHACRFGCGVDEAIEPHVKGEGVRHEPVGNKDGRIEYRCTVCDYLMESVPIPNPNILERFEVKFVKGKGTANETAIAPELGDDGELYVTLKVSSNAASGYTLDFTGYSVSGKIVSVPNVDLYYFDEYTGAKKAIDFSNSGSPIVGNLGYFSGYFYVSQKTDDVSLLIESTSGGREPVTLKVHIKAVF